MRRWNFTGFYGEYGYIIEHNNGTATLEMIAGMHKYRKKYSTLKGAKIALGKMSDSYDLKEVTHLIEQGEIYMKRYNVSFEKNGICQTNLVETDKSPVDVGLYYRDVIKAAHVFGVDYATADDERPGKPIVRI